MFDMSADVSDFLRTTDTLMQRQLPQIGVWALNWTADDALEAVKNRMQVEFDRPTRWTLGAFQVWRATRATLEAVVQERPSVGRRHYLKVQNQGGARPQTGLEKLMSTHVVSGQIMRSVIPATGGPFEAARLDAYGNWSSGERNQVLSQLQAQRDGAANTTKRSGKRARGRARYFVPKHGLAPGVYKRAAPDDIPVRVLKFSDKVPNYRPVLEFEGTIAAIYRDRLGINLRRAFERAIATQR